MHSDSRIRRSKAQEIVGRTEIHQRENPIPLYKIIRCIAMLYSQETEYGIGNCKGIPIHLQVLQKKNELPAIMTHGENFINPYHRNACGIELETKIKSLITSDKLSLAKILVNGSF